jgi:hypothetical protein
MLEALSSHPDAFAAIAVAVCLAYALWLLAEHSRVPARTKASVDRRRGA